MLQVWIVLVLLFGFTDASYATFKTDVFKYWPESKATVLGDLFTACFVGDAIVVKDILESPYVSQIDDHQVLHCLSLALASEITALSIFQAIGTSYPRLVAPDQEWSLPKPFLEALILPKLQEGTPDMRHTFILSTLETFNKPVLQFLKDTGFLNERAYISAIFSVGVFSGLDQRDLELTLWAIDMDVERAFRLSVFQFKNLLPQVIDVETLELLRDRTLTENFTESGMISLMLQSGSLQIYNHLLQAGLLDPTAAKVKSRIKYLESILKCPHARSVELYERFIIDFGIVDAFLAEHLPTMTISFGSTLTPELFERIEKYIPNKKIHHFIKNTHVGAQLMRRKDLEDVVSLMKDYLVIDSRAQPISVLEMRIALLQSIDPEWPQKVFDGSLYDPLNRSLRHIGVVKLLLNSIPPEMYPIDCSKVARSGNFINLEYLPEPLFSQFDRIYLNYQKHKSPEIYMATRLSHPSVFIWLIGPRARPINDTVGAEVVLLRILPVVIHANHYGWLIEIMRWLHRLLKAEFLDLSSCSDLSQQPPMLQFQAFLQFFKDVILSDQPILRTCQIMFVRSLLILLNQKQSIRAIIHTLLQRLSKPSFLYVLAATSTADVLYEFLQMHPTANLLLQ